MHCAGLSADIYDRYVLGLLDEPDRSQVESQIQEQCPACLSGVQRSMNLWLVFATTLENAQPSEDFRGRLVRIAELSRKVLTFPKNSAIRDRTNVLTSTLLVICAALAVLLVITWYAGRQSVRLDNTPITGELNRLASANAQLEIKSQEQEDKLKNLSNGAGSAGKMAEKVKQLEEELSKTKADVDQYKAEIGRQQQASVDNTTLLKLLANPGTRLMAMRGEATGTATAYVLVTENSELIFVGYNLPAIPVDHKYQLWIMRKEDPKMVSAGLFTPAEKGPTVVPYDHGSLVSNIAGVALTEEASDGAELPTGTKLLETGGGQSASAASPPAGF